MLHIPALPPSPSVKTKHGSQLQSVGDARLTAQAAAPPRPGGLVPAFFFDNAQQQVNEDIPAQVQIGTRGGGKDGAIKGLVAGGTSGASGVGVKPSEGSKNSKITSAEDSITDSRNTSPIIKESRKKDEPAGSENSTPTLSALALSRTSGIPVPSTADKPEPISSTTADLEKRKKSGDGGIRPREVKPRPGTGGTDTEGDDSGEEKPGHGGGGRAESTGLDAVWTAYSQGRWVNGRWAPKVSKSLSPTSEIVHGGRMCARFCCDTMHHGERCHPARSSLVSGVRVERKGRLSTQNRLSGLNEGLRTLFSSFRTKRGIEMYFRSGVHRSLLLSTLDNSSHHFFSSHVAR